ncbi:MAG TPA: hypothetical protein VLE51_03935 [Candidatus Saccharimonadales bacterium]|nr:hypothetical protein [Candidatus Saccharimonadales bacterium]HSX27493.1 hypothetical protein [Patescibacteria group bacterium]
MKAYLIPGNGEDLKSRNYQAVLDIYKKLGYQPIFVPIKWNYRTIDDWIAEVDNKIPAKEIQNSLLSGFSFGSMIALAVAAQVNPKKLLLFSLSPYFKEDFPLPKDYAKWAGKRKTENFKTFSMNDLAVKINCPTIIFIGRKEIDKYSDMDERSSEAHKRIKNSRLVVVEDVGHDVSDPKYVESIKHSLNT